MNSCVPPVRTFPPPNKTSLKHVGPEAADQTPVPPPRVSHITPHPDFRAHGFYNDVAVLKLAEDVEYTEYILPVCLPSEEYRRRPLDHLVGHTPSVIGWGSTHYGKAVLALRIGNIFT